MLDCVGGDLFRDQFYGMREAGVDVRYYNRLDWLNLGHMNNRTHRNLIVVDGKTGFIAGVGIADCWRGNAQDSYHYPKVVEPAKAQSFTSAPRSGSMCMQLLYLMSITAAEESSDLSASYFVPGPIAIASLVAVAGRGVRIRIIVPGRHMNRKLVRRASRSTWGELLAAGVRIYKYHRTMFHRKVMIVDHMWVLVGLPNVDARCFRINDEANITSTTTRSRDARPRCSKPIFRTRHSSPKKPGRGAGGPRKHWTRPRRCWRRNSDARGCCA